MYEKTLSSTRHFLATGIKHNQVFIYVELFLVINLSKRNLEALKFVPNLLY